MHKVIHTKSKKNVNYSARRAIAKHNPRNGSTCRKIMLAAPALGITSLALAAAAGGYIQNTYATDSGDDGLQFSIAAMRNIGVTLDKSAVVLAVQPKEAGQFGRASVTVDVSTNSTTGYKLTLQADKDTLTREQQVNGTTYTIGPLTSNVTCGDESDTLCSGWTSSFANNKWGYRVDNWANYQAISTSATPIKTTDGAANSSETTVYFGTKLDNAVPVGSYDGVTLTFIATTNPISKIDDLIYMQDFAYLTEEEKTSVLQSMDVDKQYTLKDSRDDKTYFVSKLQDGSVWMTQNLDFDITGPLTSESTNLTKAGEGVYTNGYSTDASGVITWTPVSSAYTIKTNSTLTGTNGEINYGDNAGKWANSDTAPYTVDVGKMYETGTYFQSSVCNDAAWSTGCNYLNGAKTTAHNGDALSTYLSTKAFEATNGEHGAIGNYYNWTAALASNDTSSITAGNVTGDNSICPAGWGLPKNGRYGTLNSTYNSGSGSGDTRDSGLFNSPLYLVRGGVVYTSSSLSTVYNAGRYGLYWSSTSSSSTGAYRLGFSSSGVDPADYINRGYGRSVRCVSL